jgi:hypothetical protein
MTFAQTVLVSAHPPRIAPGLLCAASEKQSSNQWHTDAKMLEEIHAPPTFR